MMSLANTELVVHTFLLWAYNTRKFQSSWRPNIIAETVPLSLDYVMFLGRYIVGLDVPTIQIYFLSAS
jgi:hypothetical protein